MHGSPLKPLIWAVVGAGVEDRVAKKLLRQIINRGFPEDWVSGRLKMISANS